MWNCGFSLGLAFLFCERNTNTLITFDCHCCSPLFDVTCFTNFRQFSFAACANVPSRCARDFHQNFSNLIVMHDQSTFIHLQKVDVSALYPACVFQFLLVTLILGSHHGMSSAGIALSHIESFELYASEASFMFAGRLLCLRYEHLESH